jgi:3-methylcrotonyl-CoA carboxylase alpha subunit
MFDKILIANRGEIACRVARTARRMGIRTVAVYSDADTHALHVEACDEAYRLGPPPPRESYLDGDSIIAIAKKSGAGYPSGLRLPRERAFAACARERRVHRPAAPAIAAMGSKSAAKRIMGSEGSARPAITATTRIRRCLLRRPRRSVTQADRPRPAVAAGMKIVEASDGLPRRSHRRNAKRNRRSATTACCREIPDRAAPHRDPGLADTLGNAVYLFERDCSVQRRHQKVLEEAPAPGMKPEQRRAMGEAAVAAAKAIGYVGAGTVEFIAAESFARDGAFYFMEMNTRLQVEHPVTEMITGCDLVEWQLRVAAGEPLPRTQDQLAIAGHAIEARIYAEDPDRGFLLSIGRPAPGRAADGRGRAVDTGVRAGDESRPTTIR